MTVLELYPGFEMEFRWNVVRLVAVAPAVREHEVVSQVVRVPSPRDEVVNLQSGIRELQSQLQAQSAETERFTEEMQGIVAELQQRAGELEGQNLQLQDEKDYLHEQLGQRVQQVQEMEQSTSWRLTRPLRSVGFRLQ